MSKTGEVQNNKSFALIMKEKYDNFEELLLLREF